MTTIAEQKARIKAELKNAPGMVAETRLRVVERVQLANEIKTLSDQGISQPYHQTALFYGKQRAILRGLTEDNVIHFNLPDAASWNRETGFTFPSVTQFGYRFFDTSGQEATIDDAGLYYLTKKTETNVLSTMENDSNAFIAPIPLKDQRQNILNWGATVFQRNLSHIPASGSIKIILNGEEVAGDDGLGAITGATVSGAADYQSSVVDLIFTEPVGLSDLLYIVSDSDTDPLVQAVHDRLMVETHSTNYHAVLNKKLIAGTLKLLINNAEAAVDDGSGAISGATVAGTVDYDTLSLALTFADPADRFQPISLVHDSYINEADFAESYSQVDFTLGSKNYLTSHHMNLINLAAGELNERPQLLSTMVLRRKKDHQVAGTVRIICEGLEIDPSWNPLSGEPGGTTIITEAEFKSLLGYMDIDLVNPENNNDLQNASNPYLSSTGRKEAGKYPDIEKNPFWPATDGEYLGSMVFKGHFVHWEENAGGSPIPKWSVHNDIKWQYGTNRESLGKTGQHDPGTVLAALDAIIAFTDVGNNPVPVGGIDPLTGGKTYEKVGDYVHVFNWTVDPEDPENFIKDDGEELKCYYNEVQHLKDGLLADVKDDHLAHLMVQCGLIADLDDKANEEGHVNTINTDRQAADSQFVVDTATFEAVLKNFLVYHDAFEPLNDNPTYDVSQMATLKAATENPNGYLSQFTARCQDLDDVLGTPETGGYAKIIYDSCNMAANKDIGYMRDVLDRLTSIQDIYDMIVRKQQQYQMYDDIDS